MPRWDFRPHGTIVDEETFGRVTELETRQAARLQYAVSMLTIHQSPDGSVADQADVQVGGDGPGLEGAEEFGPGGVGAGEAAEDPGQVAADPGDGGAGGGEAEDSPPGANCQSYCQPYTLPSRGPRKNHRIKPSSGSSTTTMIQSNFFSLETEL